MRSGRLAPRQAGCKRRRAGKDPGAEIPGITVPQGGRKTGRHLPFGTALLFAALRLVAASHPSLCALHWSGNAFAPGLRFPRLMWLAGGHKLL